MRRQKTPLLIGAGAAVVAVVAGVLVLRGPPRANVAETAAARGAASPSTSVANSGTASSSEPVANASVAIEPLAVASGAAAARTDASAAFPGSDAGAATSARSEGGALRPLVVDIDETAAGKTMELAPGQQLVATLDANPTTGFDWAVLTAPAALGSPEMGYVSSGNAPGSPGKRHLAWTLKTALPSGEHAVELGYARSFEKGVPPFKTYHFKVRAPSASLH